MQLSFILHNVIIWWVVCQQTTSFTITRNKEYRGSGEVVSGKDASGSEPSCEELKAMWRFSKRQSRAAEITNEIPTYRDPFSFNVWEPYYPRSRSIGGLRLDRHHGRPVYGEVVYKPRILGGGGVGVAGAGSTSGIRLHDAAERNRLFAEMAARGYGGIGLGGTAVAGGGSESGGYGGYGGYSMQRAASGPRRRQPSYRLSGGAHLPPPPQSGSFQHLKELIRTERARELQEQRKAEEAASRTQALKELTSTDHRSQNADLSYDIMEPMDEPESLSEHKVLTFPDLLAPAARFPPLEARFVDDYNYYRDRPRSHRSLFHSFDDDMTELVL